MPMMRTAALIMREMPARSSASRRCLEQRRRACPVGRRHLDPDRSVEAWSMHALRAAWLLREELSKVDAVGVIVWHGYVKRSRRTVMDRRAAELVRSLLVLGRDRAALAG